MADETRNERGQYLPGVSGNPKGKPPGGGPLTRRWRLIMEMPPGEEHIKEAAKTLGVETQTLVFYQTIGDLIAHVIMVQALRGSIESLREVGDRIDPKPKRIEISGPGGGPVRGAVTGAQSDDEREAAEEYFDTVEKRDG